MCLIHSLHSACGNTAPTVVPSPLHASVYMTSPLGVPMALCSCCMNHFQLFSVSESKMSNAKWYNQLRPYTLIAEANYPVYLPFKAVASTPTNGLHPARNPSTHGFKAKKSSWIDASWYPLALTLQCFQVKQLPFVLSSLPVVENFRIFTMNLFNSYLQTCPGLRIL